MQNLSVISLNVSIRLYLLGIGCTTANRIVTHRKYREIPAEKTSIMSRESSETKVL